jgi:uncharacterized protein (DUF2461 family)
MPKKKNKKEKKSRHLCRWCGAMRYEAKMKKINCSVGEFWVCLNGDICAATAAQYKPAKRYGAFS